MSERGGHDEGAPRAEAGEVVLRMQRATVRYGGVAAVDGVDFELRRGEVHALLGENGAGKSTLTKAMAGVVRLAEGRMLLDGREVSPASPREALALGVAMVFQETSLVPTMSVAQNLFLGQERRFNRLRGINIAAQQFMQALNFDVDPGATVAMLGAAKRQMVEIARAVLHKARVIVFDEPTATLTPEEKGHFFALVRQLVAHDVAIVFITHALEEALAVADRITVLRDARHALTGPARALDRAALVKAMVGRDLSQTFHGRRRTAARAPGERVLSVQNLRMAGVVKNTSFSVFAGQVTGVFGLVGAGRTETFKIVAGLLKRDFLHGGEVLLRGRPVRYRVPAQAVRDGIAYVTEDRKLEGFFETMSIARNVHLGLLAKLRGRRPFVSAGERRRLGEHWVRALDVKAVSPQARAIELSGGNQQKVVIARALVQSPDLVIFDEPTRGVDVGAIAEIHEQINRLADEGRAVVVISSYLPEVLALSDRILVARQGKVVEEFSALDATEERIMYAAIH
jgi:simple sugar transport system ATP-binding protein